MENKEVSIAVSQPEVKLQDFLAEVAFGEVRLEVVDKKLFVIPKQIIERPQKSGVRVAIFVDEPIQLKQV